MPKRSAKTASQNLRAAHGCRVKGVRILSQLISNVRKSLTFLAIFSFWFVSLASDCNAQCDGNCSGRCAYGVEGTCTPKSKTYGYYVTTWRQWPEKAPAVPKRMRSMSDTDPGDIQLDLPDSADESDINPELRHLKDSDDMVPSPASVPSSVSPDVNWNGSSNYDYVPPVAPMESPSVNRNDGVPPPVDMGSGATPGSDFAPSGAVDLPPAGVEGESGGGGLDDLLDGPSSILNFESRVRPNPTRPRVAVVSHHEVDAEGNPLRLTNTALAPRMTKSAPLQPYRNRVAPSRAVTRSNNPLR